MIRWGTRQPWAVELHLCAYDARVILGPWWVELAWIPGEGLEVAPPSMAPPVPPSMARRVPPEWPIRLREEHRERQEPTMSSDQIPEILRDITEVLRRRFASMASQERRP